MNDLKTKNNNKKNLQNIIIIREDHLIGTSKENPVLELPDDDRL